MNNLQNIIKNKASEYFSEMVEIRRYLHKFPELSKEEFKTSVFIQEYLRKENIEFKILAKTGIVGLIKGKNPDKKVVALRADMDALPITEENDCEYKSQNKGIMHACGHDVHMTVLMGAAKILNELKHEFEGTIKLIFQPSEETFPGGAITMINEGVLENPKPDKIFGLHVLPSLESGKIGMKSGNYMASTDEVYLTVYGKGGHGATPDLNIDPVLIGSHIVVALQQIVSRNSSPSVPTVLSFGRFIADGRTNIIPNIVKIDGTMRTFDEKWRNEAHVKIKKMSEMIAESMGGKCEVFIDKGYPFLSNDELLTQKTFSHGIEFLGENNVEHLDFRMTAEDFAYFSQRIPSCFYRLGTGNNKKGINNNLHTSKFDVDEKSIETGIGFMTYLALKELM